MFRKMHTFHNKKVNKNKSNNRNQLLHVTSAVTIQMIFIAKHAFTLNLFEYMHPMRLHELAYIYIYACCGDTQTYRKFYF